MSSLYLWGKPFVSQQNHTEQSLPRSANLHAPILSASCGENYCVIVTEDEVYGLGDNSEGQLGLGEL